MASKYNPGDTAFIVESSRIIREVKVLTVNGALVSLHFADADGGIKIRESRLFPIKKCNLYNNSCSSILFSVVLFYPRSMRGSTL